MHVDKNAFSESTNSIKQHFSFFYSLIDFTDLQQTRGDVNYKNSENLGRHANGQMCMRYICPPPSLYLVAPCDSYYYIYKILLGPKEMDHHKIY